MARLPIALLLLLVSMLLQPAHAFRCGNRIVAEGDDVAHVARICGEPTTVRQWSEVRVRPVFLHQRHHQSGGWRHTRYRHPVSLPVEIFVEQWIYDLGARRFMRILRFENGRLVDIDTTRYGSPH